MREIPSAKNLVIPALLVISLFVLQLRRSAEQIPLWRHQGLIMGTSYTVQMYHPEEVSRSTITDALSAVNQSMSTYLKTSELSELNAASAGEVRQVSAPLREVLVAAKQVSKASGGAFDVTVGPLVNAWGFGPEGRRPTPTKLKIAELKERCGDDLWSLESAGVRKSHAEVQLDLSAIAKGFAVDQVARALDAQSVKSYWIEVGGEVRVKGSKPLGGAWRVGIERPAGEGERRIFRVMSLRDQSVATSGDYRNRYRDDQGVIRSHTIDPRTGEPVRHQLASVSVFHAENMFADAWATALNVLGATEGLKVANQHKLEALFIIRARSPDNAQSDLLELDTPDTSYRAVMSEALSARLAREEE